MPSNLDKKSLVRRFNRAAASYSEAAVLYQHVANELLDRLSVVALKPENILNLGCGTGYATPRLREIYPQAHVMGLDIAFSLMRQNIHSHFVVEGDAENIPFKNASFDLVFSNLVLPWCDISVAFPEIRRLLRPGGLLTFTTFGPDTLLELRTSWAQVDENIHVHPFMDMHDLGDALLSFAFAEPVMDVERLTLTYPDPRSVSRDLRATGTTNIHHSRKKSLTGKRRFNAFEQAMEQSRTPEGLFPVTYEVVFGHAFAGSNDGVASTKVPVSVLMDR